MITKRTNVSILKKRERKKKKRSPDKRCFSFSVNYQIRGSPLMQTWLCHHSPSLWSAKACAWVLTVILFLFLLPLFFLRLLTWMCLQNPWTKRFQNEIHLVHQTARIRDPLLYPRTHCRTAYLQSMLGIFNMWGVLTDPCRLLQQVIPTDDEDETDSMGDKAFASPKKPAFSLPVMANNFRRFNARYDWMILYYIY